MDLTLNMILACVMPLIAWIPVSGRDMDTGRTRRRPGILLLSGIIVALPAGLYRLSEPAAAVNFGYFTAHNVFRSLAADGLTGVLLPLAALLVSFRTLGRPADPRSVSARASVIILGYCLADGLFALNTGGDAIIMLNAVTRSLPKLAMAPVWGILFTSAAPVRRITAIAALSVIGAAVAGLTGFLISLDHAGIAILPAMASLAVMLIVRPAAFADVPAARITEEPGTIGDGTEGRKTNRAPMNRIFTLMKDARYDEARDTAEKYLDSNGDLYLYAWHALLRWISGEKACKHIFLQRYTALGKEGQKRLRSHLEEYMGYYAPEVEVWIDKLEAMNYSRTAV